MQSSEEQTSPQTKSIMRFLRPTLNALGVPMLAVLTAMIVGGLIIAFAGGDPFMAYLGLFEGAFGSPKALSETAVWASPYIFAGLAVALAFKGGLFNIGAEMDQYYLLPEAVPLLLSSAVKLVSSGTYALIKLVRDAQAGTGPFLGGNYSGECGYAPFHDLDLKVPAEIKSRMEEINQDLHEDTIKTEVPPTKP